MATIWLTYAWGDNDTSDVDFAAQELENAGLGVSLDRWNLQAGRPLWDQIESFIQDPAQSDAWVLYATQNSLGSEACREEYRYALDRAIHTRGGDVPVIGLFPGPVDDALIPAGIRTRLYVSLTEPDWKEKIKAAAERRAPNITHPSVDPYEVQVHNLQSQTGGTYAIELRPRAGTWTPFFAAIPADEKGSVQPSVGVGPRHNPAAVSGILFFTGEGLSADGEWWLTHADNECSPTRSCYITCVELPSRVAFGVYGGPPQYYVDILP
jgi:hypothetical protein